MPLTATGRIPELFCSGKDAINTERAQDAETKLQRVKGETGKLGKGWIRDVMAAARDENDRIIKANNANIEPTGIDMADFDRIRRIKALVVLSWMLEMKDAMTANGDHGKASAENIEALRSRMPQPLKSRTFAVPAPTSTIYPVPEGKQWLNEHLTQFDSQVGMAMGAAPGVAGGTLQHMVSSPEGQVLGGVIEMGVGYFTGNPLLFILGADQVQAGVRTIATGEETYSITNRMIFTGLTKLGMKEKDAEKWAATGDFTLHLAANFGVGKMGGGGPRTVTLRGAATTSESLHQSLPWKPNPGGPRTIESAIAFAKKHGIQIPEEVDLIPVPDNMVQGAYAEYAQLGKMGGAEKVSLKTLTHKQTGKIPVRIQESVLASDEAILAVFGHEMHEINSLLTLLRVRGSIPAGEMYNLINGQYGTLHLEAVKVGDGLVLELRGATK